MLRQFLCLMLIITLVQIPFSADSPVSSSGDMKVVQEAVSCNGEGGNTGPEDFSKSVLSKDALNSYSNLHFFPNIQQSRTNRQEQSFLFAVFYQANYFRNN
ncbi:hypothetical protein [Evansella clarkii]|uniref:hypothetical protein n=1 Tax=Evansella clarkii TaxID=79879 RepID=UPI000997E802|nr:hypothetical protein [Evansella clarkii]